MTRNSLTAFFYVQITLIILAGIGYSVCPAQSVEMRRQSTGIRYTRQVDNSIPITNLATGQLITMEQYAQLIKEDPFAYHLIPIYNEYGQPDAYTMRPATAEERETHRFRDRDPAKQPKAEQAIEPFAMRDGSGKLYRSADLTGKVIVLSFLIGLDKPFWNEQQSADLRKALGSVGAADAPVVLGVLNSELPGGMDEAALKSLPFVPIPNAYGFHNKYHITTVPTYVVISKTGKVVANLQGAGNLDKLKQVLATLMP